MLISSAMTKGYREYMEDTLCIKKENKSGYLNINSCHVFDGHGGDEVSKLCEENIIPLLDYYSRLNPDMGTVLRETYASLDYLSLKKEKTCGSTAVSVLFFQKYIWFANCGDSEGIIIYKNNTTRIITQRHKVEDETWRLVPMGANITYDDGCARINRMLNVSRSIGDHHLKKFVKSSPYVTSVKNANIDFIVIASDGLWDVLTATDVKNIIYEVQRNNQKTENDKKLTLDLISVELIKESLRKGSMDNITVILISL